VAERNRLLNKLLRELLRAEHRAMDHALREARRTGETPPAAALRAIAAHSQAMRPRLIRQLDGHALVPEHARISATLTTLRYIFAERVHHDAERAYRVALHDLRHGVDVVRVLREVARLDELLGLIRWCDDWLSARRTLVARASAQLAWFGERSGAPIEPLAAQPMRTPEQPARPSTPHNLEPA
jgi:hypothetical protein